MKISIFPKEQQAYGAFNDGEIIENKPIGFPREGGETKPFSNLFYWAYAEAKTDSTIGLHPHQGFEIMSFVLKGHIRHYDTKLEEWRELKAGDAQIIRAGNGISHAEFMAKDSAMFQIWLDPDLSKTMNYEASYDDYKHQDLPISNENGISIKTYVGDNSPFLMTTKGVEITEWSFEKLRASKNLDTSKIYSIYVLDGSFKINENQVKKDDFIILSNSERLDLENEENGKVFVIASPEKLDYESYQELMQKRFANR